MRLLADVVLVTHFLVAAFIALGFVLIPLGGRLNWHFVRRRSLRILHLVGILFVAAESLFGIACPLTVWENALRASFENDGFVAFWVRRWLYYDAPLWLFGAIYVAAAIVALLAWWAVPPEPRRRSLPTAQTNR